MRRKSLLAAMIGIVLLAGCRKHPAPKPATPPPAPEPQNIFALLPDPDGRRTAIVVRNQAGEQALTEPNQAVRVARADASPGAPYLLDAAEVRRLFGRALDVLPPAEAHFVLQFDVGQGALNAASLARIPEILKAIEERHSTDIGVIGHTDTTGNADDNYKLGLQRAESVAALLRARGVAETSLFVTSHGETDPLVKTGRGVDEPQNRRVEVTIR